MATILVTGATGNIGRALIAELHALGASPIAGSPTGESVLGSAGRKVDFSDPTSLAAAFAGVDTLFLLFPLVPEKIRLAQNAADAARAAGVRFILRSSGAGADASSQIAIAKLQGTIDHIITGSGIPCCFVRPNGFMQNTLTYYAGMLRAGTLYLPMADAAISMVDVRDIAAVDARILLDPQKHAGQAYTVTGPEALTQSQIAQMISEAAGHPIAYVPIPQEAADESMHSAGMDAWTVEQMGSLNRVIAAGYAAQVTDTIATLTGKPARRLADFVRENADAWRRS